MHVCVCRCRIAKKENAHVVRPVCVTPVVYFYQMQHISNVSLCCCIFQVVVAKRSEQYTLTCNSKAGEAVTWKLGDNSLEDEENVELNGPNLTVLEVDMPSLGKYSCWKGEEMLSSTYLLLEDDEEHDLNSLITCRAKSYDCNFSCTWTSNEYTAVRLGLGQDCNESLKSCQWVSSSGQFPDGRLQFELSHNLSPYAEESTMLELTAEAISDRSIFRTTKRFYLRDIGKLSKTEPHQWHSVEDYHLKITNYHVGYNNSLPITTDHN
uniref:Interleukin-12 beta central domain-containing protein n=1 Tax=Amphilophus citrinellus TaxID=61819 RepID=A0A3Q0SWB4_AMPCI